MRILTAIFFTLISGLLLAQENYTLEKGKVTQYETDMQSYPQDTDAEAVVLCDLGETSFVRNTNEGWFDLHFRRRTKIKIFKESALEYAEVSIPYYHEGYKGEIIQDIEATAYNMIDGQLVKSQLDVKEVYKEQINNKWFVKKFAIPNVMEGTIIEYSYTLISPYMMHLPDWEFQKEIPVRHSSYIARMIPFYTYTFILQGAGKFDFQNSYEEQGNLRHYKAFEYNNMVYEYEMYNVPAFKNEGFITSKEDYIIKLDFQLSKYYGPDGIDIDVLTTWPKLCDDLLRSSSFGKYIKASQRVAKKVIPEIELASDDMEKLQSLVNYVKDNYTRNEYNGKYAQFTLKEFKTQKTGNIANLNLFLLGMLKEAGFEAEPVLLSTRDHGRIIVNFPLTTAFNYVLVLVQTDNGQLLVDATRKHIPYYIIPPRCINNSGLVVRKENPGWVSLSNNISSQKQHTIFAELTPNADSLQFKVKIQSDRYDAVYFKNKYEDNSEALKSWLESNEHNLIGDISTNNYNSETKPYSISYKASTPVQKASNKILLQPFLNTQIKENPFKQRKRTYPIDLTYSKTREYNSTIKIPEGYTITYTPENKKIKNDLFHFNYNVDVANGAIVVRAKYTFTQAVYQVEDYSKIKFYFYELVKKLNEEIILEKVDE